MRVASLLLVCVVMLLAACTEEKASGERAVPVTVAYATASQTFLGDRYTATLTPYTSVDVAFRVGGYVDSILQVPVDASSPRSKGAVQGKVDAERGTFVHKGTVLASLRTHDYQARVAAARGAVTEAETARRQAHIDLERMTTLIHSHAVSQADVDRARERADAAAAREDVARARLTEALTQLADTVLYAPVSGLITHKQIERGSLAAPGTVAYVVADFSRMRAVFGVADRIAGVIQPDAPIMVYPAGTTEPLEGHVLSVAPSANPKSYIFDVEVEIPNDHGLLKEGMTASVMLDVPAEGAFPLVPLEALVRPAGSTTGYALFTVTNDAQGMKAQQQRVSIGTVQGNMVAITEGLEFGEPVIVLGANRVYDGALVTVLSEDDTASSTTPEGAVHVAP